MSREWYIKDGNYDYRKNYWHHDQAHYKIKVFSKSGKSRVYYFVRLKALNAFIERIMKKRNFDGYTVENL